ncbi:hypothetical protein HYU09_02500 [Candidatus Woesearchaeota archaeon]|nr:hypothetical protein [Candidatus Woesearchaeota archaeon]
MKAWLKALLITIIFGVPAYFLAPMIWPTSSEMVPTQAQEPFYVLLEVIEALFFGLGMAFIILGWPLVRKFSLKNRINAIFAYFSISWLLVSWWSHDAFHRHNAMEPLGLLLIEYEFHVTLMIAGLLLAYSFFGFLKNERKAK